MRIRSRLLLLMLAVLLPGALGAAIGLRYLYQEEQALHRGSMRETARALALVLEGELAQRESVLRTLASSPSLREGNLERFYAHASDVARQRDVAIILSDLQGNQLVNTRLPFGAALPRMVAMERDFRARFGNQPTLISNVYLPPAGLGGHSFAIQVPVLDAKGLPAQFLTMGSYARDLARIFAEHRLPEGWHATIIDRDGVVAARSTDAERFVGQSVRPELRQMMLAQQEGIRRGTALSGTPGTAFFARAGPSQWSFLIAVPDSTLYGSARNATALMAAILLLLLGLALVASWFAARRIAEPVQQLRAAAESLGRNEPVPATSTGTVELDAVALALADASERTRRSTSELEERIAAAMQGFEQSQRQLVQSQKLEALGRLTGGIAHDFNNVLQTLTAGLAAAKAAPPQQAHDLLARCQRAVDRGSELARQLMAFGRVQEVRVSTLHTGGHLFESRRLLEGALPSNVLLDFDLSPDLWLVTVDPAQLELALLNLVINARDAMPQGGTMVLRGGNRVLARPRGELAAGDYVLLTLTDTGEGMAPEVIAQAMEPFFTTKGVGKGVGKGYGMGLPQAYGFARQAGGTLELESEAGVGTTATLWLPRARQKLHEAPPPVRHLPPGGPPRRVLLVEDDELVRETVASALSASGFDVFTAANADEAMLRLDGGERFDAVLTDVVMPGAIDGIQLAEHIRDKHRGIGVVIATGYTDRRVHVPGVRALPKPYDLNDAVDALNDAVHAALTG